MENDSDPKINLNLGGEEFEGTRDNLTLYTFIGDMASRSHVWAQTGPEKAGVFIFKDVAVWSEIAGFMMENGFELHVNLREVPACDEEAFQRHIDQLAEHEQIPDTFPEGWTDGAS